MTTLFTSLSRYLSKDSHTIERSSVLSPETKTRIIEKAEAVYNAYFLLHELNNTLCTTFEGQNKPIAVQVNELIQTKRLESAIQIDGIHYTITLLEQTPTTYQVKIDISQAASPKATPLLELINTHTIKATCTKTHPTYALSTCIKEHNNIFIGGPDAINLYKLHLVNIQKMIEVLKHEKESSEMSILIAMTTGSGKSFTQALWYLILWLARVNGIFGVPDELVTQLQYDFKRLLPAELVNAINLITDKDSTQALTPYSILPASLLLRQKWKEVIAIQEETWISFDEIDKIQDELDKRRILEKLLCDRPNLWLGATPSQAFYERSTAIISLSPKEKEALGISAPIYANQIVNKNIIAKTNRQYWFKTLFLLSVIANSPSLFLIHIFYSGLGSLFYITEIGKFLQKLIIRSFNLLLACTAAGIILYPFNKLAQNIMGKKSIGLLNRLQATVNNILEPEPSSVAHEYIDEIETYFSHNAIYKPKDKSIEELSTAVQWNIRSPLGLSALLLSNDVVTMTNLSLAFEGNRNLVYTNTGLKSRYGIHDKAKLGVNAGTKYDHSYEEAHRILRIEAFQNCVKQHYKTITERELTHLTNQVDFSNTTHYLAFRVLHGLIDLSLFCLTGYEKPVLNRERLHNSRELLTLVQTKLNSIPTSRQISDFLKTQSLTTALEQELVPLIESLLKWIKSSNHNTQARFVNNWSLDKELHTSLLQEGDAYRLLDIYCNQRDQIPNQIQSTLNTALDTQDYPKALEIIKDELESRQCHPSLRDLQEFCNKNKVIFNSDNRPSFTLNPNNNTTSLFPYTQDEINMLIKMGLTTLCDRSKLYGFNSAIQHVALFPKQGGAANNVSEEIQANGRLRGLDPTQAYFFFNCYEDTQIQPNSQGFLKSKHFYSEFLKAREKEQETINKTRANQIAASLLITIDQALDPLGKVNNTTVKTECHSLMHRHLSELYRGSHHEVPKTKILCKRLVKESQKYLLAYEHLIKTQLRLSLPMQISFEILGSLTRAMYYLHSVLSFLVFYLATRSTKNQIADHNAEAYAYLIKHYSLSAAITAHHTINETSKVIQQTLPSDSACLGALFSYKPYRHSVQKILNPLIKHQDHLQHLLNALPIRPDNTQDIIKRITYFVKKLDINRSDFDQNDVETSQWIQRISQEILLCQQYYANLSDNRPLLHTSHRFFKIRAPYTSAMLSATTNNLSSRYLRIGVTLLYWTIIILAIMGIPPILAIGFEYGLIACLPSINPILVEICSFLISITATIFIEGSLLINPGKLREFLFDIYPKDKVQKIKNDLRYLVEKDKLAYIKENLIPDIGQLGKQFIEKMTPLSPEEITSPETNKPDNIASCLGLEELKESSTVRTTCSF